MLWKVVNAFPESRHVILLSGRFAWQGLAFIDCYQQLIIVILTKEFINCIEIN